MQVEIGRNAGIHKSGTRMPPTIKEKRPDRSSSAEASADEEPVESVLGNICSNPGQRSMFTDSCDMRSKTTACQP